MQTQFSSPIITASLSYPSGSWSPENPSGKKIYERNFLIQFQEVRRLSLSSCRLTRNTAVQRETREFDCNGRRLEIRGQTTGRSKVNHRFLGPFVCFSITLICNVSFSCSSHSLIQNQRLHRGNSRYFLIHRNK